MDSTIAIRIQLLAKRIIALNSLFMVLESSNSYANIFIQPKNNSAHATINSMWDLNWS